MVTIKQLMSRAEDIRDTQIQGKNTSEVVGSWCVDVINYIGGSGEEYDELIRLGNEIRTESITDANSANRLGTWCVKALEFWGYRLNKHTFYYEISRNARIIQREWRDALNERRLGAWFVDYLYYIDYPGDIKPEDLLLYEFTDIQAGETLTLNLVGFTGIILWGDSSQEMNYNNQQPAYMYTTPGTYTVQIYGSCERMTSYEANNAVYDIFKQKLTSVKQWGIIAPKNTERMFYGCSKLAELPENSPEYLFANTYATNGGFSGCSMLPNVNGDFFKSFTDNVTHRGDLADYFNGCRNFTEIPTDLLQPFGSRINITAGMFQASGVTSIPVELFTYYKSESSLKLTTLYNMFAGAPVTSIPDDLLDPIKQDIQVFSGIFAGTAITEVPQKLMQNIPNAQPGGTNSLFYNCLNLTTIYAGMFTGSRMTNLTNVFASCRSLAEVPEWLFDGIVGGVSVFDAIFKNCTSLRVVPPGLFNDSMTDIPDGSASMYEAFAYSGLTETQAAMFGNNAGKIGSMEDIFRYCPTETINADTFAGCTNVTTLSRAFAGVALDTSRITSIPERLLEPCTNVADITYMFEQARSLTAVPEDFLAYSPVTSFVGIFYGCMSLASIPENFFANALNASTVINLSYIFYGIGITEIPENLLQPLPELLYVQSSFGFCHNLTAIPNNLFDNNKKIQVFANCFASRDPNTVLTGTTPKGTDGVELWERAGRAGYPTNIIGPTCFRNQNGLSNYASIPDTWRL